MADRSGESERDPSGDVGDSDTDPAPAGESKGDPPSGGESEPDPAPAGDPGPVDVEAVRERVLARHRGTVREVLSAADAVADARAASASGEDRAASAPTGGRALADRLRGEIERRGLADRLVALLTDAVAAAERDLPVEPVAAPPYLAVTSRGPVCRATLPEGRLVVEVVAFRVERGVGPDGRERSVRYVRAGEDPSEALDVTFETPGSPTGEQ